jgi:hypothetical protein
MSESEATRQAMNVTPATASATVGTGTSCFTTSTTASVIDLYAAADRPYENLYDCYLKIVADGANVYYAFSSASTPGIDETVGHATSPTSATTTAVPDLLVDGQPEWVRLTKGDHRYLHLKAASGTPKVRIRRSSQPKYNSGMGTP